MRPLRVKQNYHNEPQKHTFGVCVQVSLRMNLSKIAFMIVASAVSLCV